MCSSGLQLKTRQTTTNCQWLLPNEHTHRRRFPPITKAARSGPDCYRDEINRSLTSLRLSYFIIDQLWKISQRQQIKMTSATASNRVLREVLRTELTSGSSTSDVRKKDFKSLASYNWQDKTSPTIIVPGAKINPILLLPLPHNMLYLSFCPLNILRPIRLMAVYLQVRQQDGLQSHLARGFHKIQAW